jgi:hypothetical protein
MEFDADAPLAVVILVVSNVVGSDRTIVQLDALRNAKHIIFGQRLVQDDMIELRDLAARVGQLLGQVTIVGEQQQACSLLVETAHRIDALWARVLDKFHHGVTLIRVIGSGDLAFRLVQQDVTKLLAIEGLTTVDYLVFSLHLIAHRGNHFTIHLHAASLDEVIGFAARADATVGQVFVQADLASGFRTIVQRVFLTDIALTATARLFFILKTATWAVVKTAIATTRSVIIESATRALLIVKTTPWTVVIKSTARSIIIMETALTRFVIIEATARMLIIVESAARTVVKTAFATRFVIIKTAAGSVFIVKSTTRTVIVVETAFTRFVVIKTTAWTLIIIETAARTVITTAFTVFVIKAAAGTVTKLTVAEPAVATIVIKSALTSRLVAKTSLFASFLVTVAVIELEGPSLLEFFISRLSGARTLARSFVFSHL